MQNMSHRYLVFLSERIELVELTLTESCSEHLRFFGLSLSCQSYLHEVVSRLCLLLLELVKGQSFNEFHSGSC